MNIENVVVFGFEPAFRGMRNPMDSWSLSDSKFYYGNPKINGISTPERPCIGTEDLKLACGLIKSGGSHRKFLRHILVWSDLTLPRYIWTELDTYKVGTVRNSCSSMNKLWNRDLVKEDFQDGEVLPGVLEFLNTNAALYRSNKSKEGLRLLKMHLPESFLQRATYSFSYEVGLRMYLDRRGHRLAEWSGPGGICEWIRTLPYMDRFLDASGS